MFKRTLLTAAAAALVAAAPASATTFDGRCSAVGTAHYAGGGLVPKPMDWTAEAAGVCTGTLDGVEVMSRKVVVELDVHDRAAGCANVWADVAGLIRFLDARGRRTKAKLRFAIPTWRFITFTAHGRDGGTAVGAFSAFFEALEFQQDGVQQCVESRVNDYPFGFRLATIEALRG